MPSNIVTYECCLFGRRVLPDQGTYVVVFSVPWFKVYRATASHITGIFESFARVGVLGMPQRQQLPFSASSIAE
jgi:hypothetical protein